jgi:hypothetical protein
MMIKAPKDFWAGLMFFVFGLAFMLVARNYNMGTAVRMGPAYFPVVLGGILAVLGLIIFAKSFFTAGEQVAKLYFRPLLLVLGAVIVFALLLKPLGLVAAVFALTGISALGGYEFKAKEVVILAVVLAAFAVGVFFYGLGLPFNLWPGQ